MSIFKIFDNELFKAFKFSLLDIINTEINSAKTNTIGISIIIESF